MAPKRRKLHRRQNARKLAEIERLLGEDFESLAQAKRALKRETKLVSQKGGTSKSQGPKRTAPTRKAAVRPVPSRKRTYELADLPEALEQVTLNATLEELTDNSANYDALLHPGDIWGARIGVDRVNSGYTYQAFNTFKQLIAYLENYQFATKYGDLESAKDDLVGTIKIIRFKAPGEVTQSQSYDAWVRRKVAERGRIVERKRQRILKSREKEKELRAAKKREASMDRELFEQKFITRRMQSERDQAVKELKELKAQLKKERKKK